MKFDPAAATIAYHRDLENRDLAAMENWFAETAAYQSQGLGKISGRGGIIEVLRQYFASNSDHAAQDHSVIAMSDYVAESQWSLSSNGQKRQGTERITFDASGKITSIVVTDTQA